MPDFLKRWPSSLTFPLVLLLVVICFYWKIAFTYQFDWLWGPDLAQQVLPWFEEESRQMQHSRAPLWDPHAWAGQPLLAQAQPGAAYPLNWVLFLMPHKHGHIPMWALQWYYIAIHFMAALFCYLLCRDLGRSPPASLVAGLIFGLAGFVGTNNWPQMVNGAVWAPLVFLFLVRAALGTRPLASTALSGMFLGIAWLSGHHQVPIYLSLTAAGVWLYYALRSGRPEWRLVWLATLFFVTAFVVGALQILPAEEYARLSLRWVGAADAIPWNQAVPYYIHQQYSLYALSLFAVVIPGLNRNADPFIGLVALTLAISGIALCWRHHVVKLFSAIAISGIIYSLGHNSVFQGLLYAIVPLVDKARTPSMAIVMFGFGAAVLAAYGIDHYDGDAAFGWSRRITIGVLAFGVILYIIILHLLYLKNAWDRDDRIALTALIAILLAALLYGWRSGNLSRRQALTLMTLLLLLEVGNDSGYTFANRAETERRSYIDKVWSNSDLEGYLTQQGRPFRIEIKTDHLALNWAEYHNFDAVEQYTASATTDILHTGWHTWNGRMLLGVHYSLGEKPERPEQQEVFTAQSGIKIFFNPDAFPRAWSVHEIVPVKSTAETDAAISERLIELHWKAFVQGDAPQVAACDTASDKVTFGRNDAERIEVRASMTCDGMVVVSDTYYPGWVAWVDGQPARIYKVNSIMRGIAVPRGSHLVTMRYRPKSVYLGAALTALGVFGTLALAFVSRKDGPTH